MPTLLIRNADCVATFDHPDSSQARELRQASVFIRDNRIEAIGPAHDLPTTADEVIDARGHLVLPGLVNTHHHMYQSLTRAIPQTQNAELFGWLRPFALQENRGESARLLDWFRQPMLKPETGCESPARWRWGNWVLGG